MTAPSDKTPLRVAVEVADDGLAARVARLIAGVPGLALVQPGEGADLVVTAPAAAPAIAPGPDAALTPRELDVLELLATGASNKEIARDLGISVHTAKFHVGSLMNKLDAVDRTEALAQAARRRVIHL